MHAIYELKDTLCDELEDYGKKDKLDLGSLDVVDKLAHTIKNLDKIIESYESQEYSSAMYDDGMSYGDGSYARGGNRMSYSRTRGRKRDSMGRYSSDSKMMVEELRDLMRDAPDERTKMEFKKFIQKVEQMG